MPVRLPANRVLQERIGYLLNHPGRPPVSRPTILRELHLSGWNVDKAAPYRRQGRMASGRTLSARRRIVANMARSPENVVAFYNKRGTCELWIKEGKGAVKWTRLSCRSFAANAVRLQLMRFAYNLGNLPAYARDARAGRA
jgi:hypothetical protein